MEGNNNQQYQTPSYQNPLTYEDNTPLTIGNYIVMMIVGSIPIVGLIMTIIWAFSGNTNKNRKNYARALLIMMLIAVVLGIVFGASIFAAIASLGNSAY
jgi:membrane protein DedA with SNARE-associated domain